MATIKLITQLTNPDLGGTWTLTSSPISPVTILANGQIQTLVTGGVLLGDHNVIVDFTNSPYGVYVFNYNITSDCDDQDATVTIDYSVCNLGCFNTSKCN